MSELKFVCELCQFACSSRLSYITHYRLHKNVHNVQFPCAIKFCNRRFSKYTSFRQHVLRDHSHSFIKQPRMLVKCNLEVCNNIHFGNVKLFFSHLRLHILQGLKVDCPYLNCKSSFTNKSSFTSHLTRYHKHISYESFRNVINDHNPASISVDSDIRGDQNIEINSNSDLLPEHSQENAENNSELSGNSQENIIRSLALFNLKLQAKNILPNSVIQSINQQIFEINDLAVNWTCETLKEKLSPLLPQTESSEILCHIRNNELLQSSNSILGTSYKRLNYYKKQFNYISPVEIYLGKNDLKKDCYIQYVPVLKTLTILLQNTKIQEHFQEYKQEISPTGVLTDVKDGLSYKRNKLFESNPESLALIFFQDAFELVNPLGSARKKHSIVGVYFHLANFSPSQRSNIENIQLALLCREKDLKFFGVDKIFRKLITDIAILEKEGIDINGVNHKGTICSIVGDNLGSHTIGGFLENFNCEYFCRFCLITKSHFKSIPYKVDKLRTPELYDSSLSELVNFESHHGIKLKSPFNDLDFFHVSQPGLPPCLAHDLFEGIVPYDLHLIFNYFTEEKKWFTRSYLNRTIASFHYKGTDARNKPNPMNVQTAKLNGHATQNWCLLRLLPILIGHKISDKNNPVWDLCLRLRKIVEMVCAPKISIEQVCYLHVLVEEYLELRAEIFVTPLKPKHHFLLHYAYLISQFGPLIRLWTLRFESKHSYFKKCAKQCKNFKNICSTLAVHHQLLQAYVHEGNFFPMKISTNGSVNFCAASFSVAIQNAIPSNISSLNTIMSYDVTVEGIQYCKDFFLPLSKNLHGVIFGKILFVLINNISELYFVIEKVQSVYLEDLGVYFLQFTSEMQSDISCIRLSDVLDYYPLVAYNVYKGLHLCLHHSFIGI